MARKPNTSAATSAVTNITDATYAEFRQEYGQAVRRKDEAVGLVRNVLKRAKSAGIDTRAMLEVAAMRKMEPEEVIARRRAVEQYARWEGLPVGTQGALFNEDVVLSDARPAVVGEFAKADAEAAGYESGRAGGDRVGDNPFDPGTPVHVAFDEGFQRGQRLIAGEMKATSKRASVSKTKPDVIDLRTRRRARGAGAADAH